MRCETLTMISIFEHENRFFIGKRSHRLSLKFGQLRLFGAVLNLHPRKDQSRRKNRRNHQPPAPYANILNQKYKKRDE